VRQRRWELTAPVFRSRVSSCATNLTTRSRVASALFDRGHVAIEIHNDQARRLRSSSGRSATTTEASRQIGVLEQEQEGEQRLALLSDALIGLSPRGEQVPESFDLLEVIEKVLTEDGRQAIRLEKTVPGIRNTNRHFGHRPHQASKKSARERYA